MYSELDKKICQKHKLKIKTIDLKQSTADEDKYLCIKCLIEKIDIQNMAMVEETKALIKQMKSEQQSNKIKENQRRMENFKQLQLQIKELKVSIDNTIEKVQSNIEQKIALIEKEFEEQESKQQSFEEDVKVLSKNYKGCFSFEIPKELDRCLDENKYIDSIQEQLQSLFRCPQFEKIKEILMKTKVEQENQEVKKVQFQTQKQEDFLKTPCLKIQCNKHGKEIIMLNLNPNETKYSRLACVECIQQNDPIKYTTLSDASLRWNEYRGQTDDKIQRFQNNQSQQQAIVIEVLEDFKEISNSTIFDIINKVNMQSSICSPYETNEFKEDVIFGMNIEQLNELTETLSKEDKFKALAEKQITIEKQVYDQYQSITNNMSKLLQNVITANQKLTSIFIRQNFRKNENQEQKSDIVQEEYLLSNQHLIDNLNLQLQQSSLYEDIVKEAFKQNETIISAIEELNNKLQNEQLQQFKLLVSKFERDSFLMNKMIKFDQIEKELKNYEKQNQVLENELIEMEKRNQNNIQVISDLKKDDAKQIQLIEDLRNENQELSSKLKLVEQQSKNSILLNFLQKQDLKYNLKTIKQTYKLHSNLIRTTSKQLNKHNHLQQNLYLKQLQQQQFSQSLTFSKIHKPSELAVTQNGKVIEQKLNTWSCCMCDQMIPKNGLILFAIKIIEITYIMIGIGFRDIVQNNNYKDCYSIGKGTYNIHNNGWCFNHDQQDQNQKKLAFQFSRDDIIIVEVDIEKKYVKWTKQTTNEQFTLAIDASKDLYPCVYLWGNCKVEILNQVFN